MAADGLSVILLCQQAVSANAIPVAPYVAPSLQASISCCHAGCHCYPCCSLPIALALIFVQLSQLTLKAHHKNKPELIQKQVSITFYPVISNTLQLIRSVKNNFSISRKRNRLVFYQLV